MIAEIPLHKITREVCECYGVTLDDLRQQNRSSLLVPIRQELYYRLRESKLYSWQKIGSHLCRDHTTIRQGYAAHKRRIAQ